MPDGDIGRIDQYMIREKINALLNALYIPSRTELALLSELVRTMKAHCRLTYTSDRQFIQELYTAPEDRHIEPSLPICLTGPAGVGKTSLLLALSRLLPETCRSEEHTSELQSLMRISYAVFC